MTYHLTPFEYGQIKAHLHHGLKPASIRKLVVRENGDEFSERCMLDACHFMRDNPDYRGERAEGSGRPRTTTKKQDRQIVNAVLKHRGQERVSVAWVKKKFIFARDLSDFLIEERLHDAGLKYLRRRAETVVLKLYKPERKAYADWILAKPNSWFSRVAFTDGTVWYLDTCEDQTGQRQRAALGHSVWRRADRADSLHEDTVGASRYVKAQGSPVKVWGVLAEGELSVYILPQGQAMNRWWYSWLVEARFPQWLGQCDRLICDFEGCIRTDEALASLKKISVQLVDGYPRVSQDLNHIETVWAWLKHRMTTTLPPDKESREAFIQRLRNAVVWLNRNKKSSLEALCSPAEHKKRCQELKDLKGCRTSF